jgi:hypothetical protein
MPDEFPWYDVVEGYVLEQGDILLACRVPVLPPAIPDGNEIPAKLVVFDVVVMTQSCDLQQEKVQDVIICPHWSLTTAGTMEEALAKKDTWKSINKGREHRYAMLAGWEDSDPKMEIRIVDFGRIFSMARAYLSQLALDQGKRLRLRPPYREHLSQSFARYFMRVGLPEDIKLP